jgi:hypothetical protein
MSTSSVNSTRSRCGAGRFGLLDAGSSCEPFHHLPVGGVSAFASVGRDRRFGIAAGQEAVLLVGEQT